MTLTRYTRPRFTIWVTSAVTDIRLEWEDFRSIFPCSDYRLYRGLASNYQFTLIATQSGRTYIDSAVNPLLTYVYYTEATITATGEVIRSNYVEARIDASYSALTLTLVDQLSPDINLSWAGWQSSFGTFVEYRLYRAIDNGPFSLLATTSFGVTTYADSDVIRGPAYHYYVTVVSDAGQTVPSNIVIAYLELPVPTLVLVDQAFPGIKVSWSIPSGRGTVVAWHLYRAAGDHMASSTLFQTLGAMVLDYDDTSAVKAQQYTYRVIAVMSQGDTDLSNYIEAMIPGFSQILVGRDGSQIFDMDITDMNNVLTLRQADTSQTGNMTDKNALVTPTRLFLVTVGGLLTIDRSSLAEIHLQSSLNPMGSLFNLGNNKYVLPNYGQLLRLETSDDGASWTIVGSGDYSNGANFSRDGYGVFRQADSQFYCVERNAIGYNWPVKYNILGASGFLYTQVGYFDYGPSGFVFGESWEGPIGWGPTCLKHPYLYCSGINLKRPGENNASGHYILIWDVTNTNYPVNYIKTDDPQGVTYPVTMWKRGNYLFVGYIDGNSIDFAQVLTAFRVYDISNPSAPVLLASPTHSGNGVSRLSSIVTNGNFLYSVVWEKHDTGLPGTAYKRGYLIIYDITNPAAPTFISKTRCGISPANSDPDCLTYNTGTDESDCNLGEDT